MLRLCRREGIHTAIDTAGSVPLSVCQPAVDLSDMLLLDIKSIDSALCRRITGQGNQNALCLLDHCEGQGKPVWIRHVVVPGLTLDDAQLKALASHLQNYSCVARVELLPFHKLGEYKWEQLGRHYTLGGTREPTAEEMNHARAIFQQYGLPVR